MCTLGNDHISIIYFVLFILFIHRNIDFYINSYSLELKH